MADLIALFVLVVLIVLVVSVLRPRAPSHLRRGLRVGPPGESIEAWIERRRRQRPSRIRRPGEAVEGRTVAAAPAPARSVFPRRSVVLGLSLVGAACFLLFFALFVPLARLLGPLVFLGFFVVLFAVQFLPLNKIRYALYATAPVTLLVFVNAAFGSRVVLPVAVVLGTLLAGFLFFWSRRTPRRSDWARRFGAKRLKIPEKGRKTEDLLGAPKTGYDHARPGRLLEPVRGTKSKGMYFRIP